MRKKILTYIVKIVKYILKAVLDKLRKDVGDKKDSGK